MKRTSTFAFAIAGALILVSGAANAGVNTFDSVGDTAGATVDRYAPAVFTSGVSFAGHLTLEEGTSAADKQTNGFLNTQGKAFALDPGTQNISIQLYVPGDWAKDQVSGVSRFAGFWGVASDATNAISSYPIIELANTGGSDFWRAWDSAGSGSWLTLGNAVDDVWTTLGISLVGGNFEYSINGNVLGSVGALGSTKIDSTILQVYNTPNGVVRTAHWDDLTSSVPEPTTWAMMIVGLGAVGAAMRRSRATSRSIAFS